jgi:hypothetical protein
MIPLRFADYVGVRPEELFALGRGDNAGEHAMLFERGATPWDVSIQLYFGVRPS